MAPNNLICYRVNLKLRSPWSFSWTLCDGHEMYAGLCIEHHDMCIRKPATSFFGLVRVESQKVEKEAKTQKESSFLNSLPGLKSWIFSWCGLEGTLKMGVSVWRRGMQSISNYHALNDMCSDTSHKATQNMVARFRPSRVSYSNGGPGSLLWICTCMIWATSSAQLSVSFGFLRQYNDSLRLYSP